MWGGKQSFIIITTEAVWKQARRGRWKEQAEPRRRFTSLIGWGGWLTGSLSGSELSVWGGLESEGVSVWRELGEFETRLKLSSVLSCPVAWDLLLSAGINWGALEDSQAPLATETAELRTWACGSVARALSGGRVAACGGLLWSDGSFVLSPGCCLESCCRDSRYACSCCRRLWRRSALRCSSSSRHLNSCRRA